MKNLQASSKEYFHELNLRELSENRTCLRNFVNKIKYKQYEPEIHVYHLHK